MEQIDYFETILLEAKILAAEIEYTQQMVRESCIKTEQIYNNAKK
jgi:hypothetical protein